MDKGVVPKYSLSDWKKYVWQILLIIAINIIWALFMFVFNRADSNTDNAYRISEDYRESYLRCSETIQKYTDAILYKNAQIETRDKVINTLKHSTDTTNNTTKNEK